MQRPRCRLGSIFATSEQPPFMVWSLQALANFAVRPASSLQVPVTVRRGRLTICPQTPSALADQASASPHWSAAITCSLQHWNFSVGNTCRACSAATVLPLAHPLLMHPCVMYVRDVQRSGDEEAMLGARSACAEWVVAANRQLCQSHERYQSMPSLALSAPGLRHPSSCLADSSSTSPF
jgi:hypothetical protein